MQNFNFTSFVDWCTTSEVLFSMFRSTLESFLDPLYWYYSAALWKTWCYFPLQGEGGGGFNLNAQVFFSLGGFPRSSQALLPQGGTQGSGIGDFGVLLATVYSRGCRDYSGPTLVTPKYGVLHFGSAVMVIYLRIT